MSACYGVDPGVAQISVLWAPSACYGVNPGIAQVSVLQATSACYGLDPCQVQISVLQAATSACYGIDPSVAQISVLLVPSACLWRRFLRSTSICASSYEWLLRRRTPRSTGIRATNYECLYGVDLIMKVLVVSEISDKPVTLRYLCVGVITMVRFFVHEIM